MIKYEHYKFGKIGGYVYSFARKGDTIPAHTHSDPLPTHNIIVLRGRVKVSGPGFDVTMTTGCVMDIQKGHEHAITALEDGTRTMHLFDDCPVDFEAVGEGTYGSGD